MAATICVDKTLISLNVLNPNEHAHAVLSAQIAAAATTAYIDTHAVFALAMLPLRQLQNVLCFFGQRTLHQ